MTRNGETPLQERFSLGVTALIAIEHAEIAERLGDIQMFGTVHSLVHRQASFQDRFRYGEPAVSHIGIAQAAEHHRRDRAVRSKPALCLGKHTFAKRCSLRIFAVMSELAHLAVEKDNLVRLAALRKDGRHVLDQHPQRQHGYRQGFGSDRTHSEGHH